MSLAPALKVTKLATVSGPDCVIAPVEPSVRPPAPLIDDVPRSVAIPLFTMELRPPVVFRDTAPWNWLPRAIVMALAPALNVVVPVTFRPAPVWVIRLPAVVTDRLPV